MSLPTIILLHGDDGFAIRRASEEILAPLGDPAMVDLNLTRLDAPMPDDIYAAAAAMPFLAERRVVIVTHPLSRLSAETSRERFRAVLDDLPETALVVLVLEDEIERGDWLRLPEKKSNWLRKWMNTAGERLEYRLCRLPAAREMPGWILRETRTLGGQITPQAAAALAQHVGSDTGAAIREIEKLLIYVSFARVIEADDVELLSAQSGQANMFDMVDAIANGNLRLALNLLHRLLEDEEENNLFGMIVRQFRLLIQAREVMDEYRRADAERIAQELRIHPYVASKLADQAGRFQMARLKAIYHRLLDIDAAFKTSQTPMAVALDTFVAELAR